MIATFPQFSSLDFLHRDEVQAITAKYASYSDFNFVSLYAWNVDGSTSISLLNDNLVICLPDYMDSHPVYSILGTMQADNSLAQLLTVTDRLELVPSVFVKSLKDTDSYIITESRDNFDYMYELSSIAALVGGELKKKRNKLNRVQKALGQRLSTSTVTKVAKPELLLLLFEHWAVQNHKPEESIKAEAEALRRILYRTEELGLLVTDLSIDDELCGFSINELLPRQSSITHFEKTLLPHEDIPVYMTHLAIDELIKHGARKVNWEQDLGIPGLRQAKMSYRPSGFLKKYTISKR